MARILVVDDDAQMVSVLRLTFQTGGHQVTYTQEPKQVISMIESEAVDAIVLDVMMPEISGWELLDLLRCHPRAEHTPIVILSALTDAADRVRAIRSGADDFLVKPFHPDELLARVESLIPRKLARATGLQGSLDFHTAAEIVQNLEQHRKSGVLEITSGKDSGSLEMIDGKLSRADFAGLRSDEAVLAMSSLTQGRFRFLSNRPQPDSGQDLHSFQPVLVQAAWLEDELRLRQPLLPPPDVELRLVDELPPTPTGWDEVPIDTVLDEISRADQPTLGGLLERKLAAPSKVRLAVAWLLEHQVIRAA